MKIRNFMWFNAMFLSFALMILLPFISAQTASVSAQEGNSITGQVFGYEREPLYDVYVELLNEYAQAVKQTRTDSAGRYGFYGLGPGRYSVRIRPYGTDYEEQTQEVEIVNFVREDQQGNRRLSGFSREQLDFNLKLKKGLNPGTTGSIFIQEVPDDAKKLYQQAVEDLNNKRDAEGLAGLKAAIEKFPRYFAALERLGNEYVRLRYFEAAQYLFAAAVEVNPRGYRSWFGLAYSAYSLNKFAEATIAIQKSLELYQGSAEAFLLSGILMRYNKKFTEAEKHLLKAKELAKDTMPLVHWHLALLYGNDLKRYGDAAKELKLFLKAQPNAKDKEKIEQLIKDFEERAKAAE